MAVFTLRTAAQEAGTSKSTILRAMIAWALTAAAVGFVVAVLAGVV